MSKYSWFIDFLLQKGWLLKPMRTNLLLASALLSLVLSCSSQTGSRQKGTLSPKSPSTYSIDELDQLYSPLRQDTFILSEGHDEFRAPIEDLFSDEERKAHRTQILEYTWSMNKDSLLTVWYLPLQDSLKVLGKFSYPRDAVF